MILVAIVTGINVAQIFLRDPWTAFSAIWSQVYLAGNVVWVLFVVGVLYTTNWDDWLLKRLRI